MCHLFGIQEIEKEHEDGEWLRLYSCQLEPQSKKHHLEVSSVMGFPFG